MNATVEREHWEIGDTALFRPKYHTSDVPVTLVSFTEVTPGFCQYSWYSQETAVVYGTTDHNPYSAVRPVDPLVRQANYLEAQAHYRTHLSQYPVWRERFEENPDYPVFALPFSLWRSRPFDFGWARTQSTPA